MLLTVAHRAGHVERSVRQPDRSGRRFGHARGFHRFITLVRVASRWPRPDLDSFRESSELGSPPEESSRNQRPAGCSAPPALASYTPGRGGARRLRSTLRVRLNWLDSSFALGVWLTGRYEARADRVVVCSMIGRLITPRAPARKLPRVRSVHVPPGGRIDQDRCESAAALRTFLRG